MVVLIMLLVVAIAAAFFATQNTDVGSLTIASYHLAGIPMYLIVLGSVLVGLLVSAVLSFVNSVASSFEIHGKDSKINEGKKNAVDLTKQIHQLELENIRLKTELEKMPDEKSI